MATKVKLSKQNGRYTKEDKIEALLLLRKNDFRLDETAKQLGIGVDTLRYWRTTLGKAIMGSAIELNKAKKTDEMQRLKEGMEESEEQLSIIKAARSLTRREGDFINAVYVAKLTLIDRINELAKKAKNIKDIAIAFDILQKASTGINNPDYEDEFAKRKKNFVDMVKDQYGAAIIMNMTDTEDVEFQEMQQQH